MTLIVLSPAGYGKPPVVMALCAVFLIGALKMSKLDKCEDCKGSGYLYTKIAGDKHISVCSNCEGYGTFTRQRPRKEKKPVQNFGAVNLDSILANE
jgi:hypothetical protein